MNLSWLSRTALAACCLIGTSGMAHAITWTFTGSGGEGTIGNSRTFTAEGITITATAWSYDSRAGFQQARLGLWSTGLGVCSITEPCGNPSHQVDNAGQHEYVLFQFSAPIDPISVRIDPYGTYDRDVSYWTGNITLPSDLLVGETYSSLTGLGFFSRIDNNGTVSSSPRDVPIISPVVNAMLFGPRYNGGGDDYFKITSLTGVASSVPEPSSWLLLSLGLLGWIWLQTRKEFRA